MRTQVECRSCEALDEFWEMCAMHFPGMIWKVDCSEEPEVRLPVLYMLVWHIHTTRERREERRRNYLVLKVCVKAARWHNRVVSSSSAAYTQQRMAPAQFVDHLDPLAHVPKFLNF